jgi:hypothetical protein
MDDFFVMRELQGGANLRDQFQRLARLKGFGLDELPQVRPIHELHDEIVILHGLAEIV